MALLNIFQTFYEILPNMGEREASAQIARAQREGEAANPERKAKGQRCGALR